MASTGLKRRCAAGLLLAALLGACGGGGPRACVSGDGASDPHPPGWATVSGGGVARFHGAAALACTDCVRCHAQVDATLLCVACHGAGGVVPHPAGWIANHPASEIPANAPADLGGGIQVRCLVCHTPGPG